MTFIDLTHKNSVRSSLVAGTLAETVGTTSRWGSERSGEEIEKMRRDSAVARHASLVRLLKKKLVLVSYTKHSYIVMSYMNQGYFGHSHEHPDLLYVIAGERKDEKGRKGVGKSSRISTAITTSY